MSEKAPANYTVEALEGNEKPSSVQVLDAFENKRLSLNESLAEVQARPGFKLDANEMMAKRREEREAQRQLAGFEAAYSELGGDAIDAAQANVDALDFKANANEHVAAKAALRDARTAFYENFLRSQEAQQDADSSQPEASVEEEADERIQYDVDADVADVVKRLNEKAKSKELAIVDEMNSTPQAKADKELLGEEVSKDGLEPLPEVEDEKLSDEVSKDGLEPLSEDEGGNGDEEKTPVHEHESVYENGELLEAANRYAELTARDRKSYFIGRYMRDERSLTGKILGKIPGVRKAIDSLNEKQGAEITDARKQYELAVFEAQRQVIIDLERSDSSRVDMQAAAALIAGEADLALESMVISQRETQSKGSNKFVDWWVKQEGFKGKLKKAAVVAGVGLATGLTGGAFLGTVAGSLIGGVAGGVVANHVTRRRANAEGADGFNLAESQALADSEEKAGIIQKSIDDTTEENPAYLASESLNEVTEKRSDSEAFQNRSRLRKAVAIGKGAVVGAGLLRNGISELFDSALDKPDAPEAPAPDKPDVPAPEVSKGPEIVGDNFTVEAGNGYIKELQDFGSANGHDLTPQQAENLHHHLMDKFGNDYIDIKGAGGDIYMQGTDVRLMEPGKAAWENGVTAEAQKWMANRGLW